MQMHPPTLVAKIMLLEDDDDLAELVLLQLRFQGHQVVRVQSLHQASQTYRDQHFDLLILDRSVPDGDGLDFCHSLREKQDWCSVLMLTARDSELEKVAGLEAGVDDYITKPFSILEFQARVRNVLRRINQIKPTHSQAEEKEPILQFGHLSIYPQQHQVFVDNQAIELTATEFNLLLYLASRPGRVLNKDQLLDQVWNTQHTGYHHTVCSTINRLRSKLSVNDKTSPFIQTVWGVGYKFLAS